jgi:FMN phosphatase YigB (HAD superfamily)
MKAILFDLDGTLLPMDETEFTKVYFALLAKKLAPLGADSKKLIDAVWTGTKKMVLNNGEKTNGEVFWEAFADEMSQFNVEEMHKACDEFYLNEFEGARTATRENPLAKRVIEASRKKADYVILATNPIFPRNAQSKRLSWIGLKESDFDLVTSYESDFFCKPNVKYYESILKRFNLSPSDCIMIGNDEREDAAASEIGIECYLVTDCIIKNPDREWTGKRGTFADMAKEIFNVTN